MAIFRFELVSPQKLLFSGDVEQVDVPGSEGDFGVLADHAPLVTTLRPGILTIHASGAEHKFVVFGGFAEVSGSTLTVLADAAGAAEDIDQTAIETRMEELQQRIDKLDPCAELDKLITQLDHYKSVNAYLVGTAMH